MINLKNSYFQNLPAKISTVLFKLFTLLKIFPIFFQSFSNIINIMLNSIGSNNKVKDSLTYPSPHSKHLFIQRRGPLPRPSSSAGRTWSSTHVSGRLKVEHDKPALHTADPYGDNLRLLSSSHCNVQSPSLRNR